MTEYSLGTRLLKGLVVPMVAIAAMVTGASAHTFKVLYSFCAAANCTDGAEPEAGLALGPDGTLYGTTGFGGRTGAGSVFALRRDPATGTWTEQVLYSFCARPDCGDSFIPDSALVIDTAGNLYGMTLGGQDQDNPGTVFRLSPNAERSKWTLDILHRFCRKACTDGTFTLSGLTYAGDGAGALYDGVSPLYGTTVLGGPDQTGGLAFALTPVESQKWDFSILYDFCARDYCTDGQLPYTAPVVDDTGTLTGVTAYGGIGYGVVYQLSRKPHGHMWNQRVLHDFCSQPNCSDGAQPWDLASDGPGTFLGVTAVGGAFCGSANRCGTVFRMDAAGNETVLYNFCSQPDCADGSTPVSAPVADATGALIGTTFRGGGHDIDRQGLGGGTIYALNGSFRTLHRFCARAACADGANPEGRLIADGMGHFYGVTYGGGAHGHGAVFEIVP